VEWPPAARIVVRNGVFLLISADGSTVYRLSARG
jgi:hypothetical protein